MHTSAFLSSGAGGSSLGSGSGGPALSGTAGHDRANRTIDGFGSGLGVQNDPLFHASVGVALGIFCKIIKKNRFSAHPAHSAFSNCYNPVRIGVASGIFYFLGDSYKTLRRVQIGPWRAPKLVPKSLRFLIPLRQGRS